MKGSTVILSLLLITLILVFSAAEATEQGESSIPTIPKDQTEEITGLHASPDVVATYKLLEVAKPKSEAGNTQIEVGKIVDILLGFQNNGENTLNVFYIQGHLLLPQDFTYIVQNFTGFRYNVTIKPNQAHTMLYRFRTDPRLEARDFGISVNVYYRNVEDNYTFAQSFYNETITLVDTPKIFDFNLIFAYFLIIAMFVGGGYFVYKQFLEEKLMKSQPKQERVESKEEQKEVKEEYLAPHVKQFLEQQKKDEEEKKKSLLTKKSKDE